MVNVLLVDSDRSFRLGLRAWLEKYPGWQITGEAGTKEEALALMQRQSFDLLILELAIEGGLELCQQVKQNYSTVKIFLLTELPRSVLVEGALALGVEGYSPKGVSGRRLLQSLTTVATGHKYQWSSPLSPSLWRLVRMYMRDTGLAEIDLTLFAVHQQLSRPGLAPFVRLVLEGRRRELRCARWLVERLWRVEQPSEVIFASPKQELTLSLPDRLLANIPPKWQQGIENLTEFPLEIDILLPEKRQELLAITLAEFRHTLAQCQRSQITADQLQTQWLEIVTDLWQRTAESFFGKYTVITDRVLQDRPLVQKAMLQPLPLVPELLSALLFGTPLTLLDENANLTAEMYLQDLLDNLCIQVANAVVQPLLNNFAQDEGVRKRLFQYKSTREIERFRNELSWKYRYKNWFGEPRHIFESKQELLVFTATGIDRVYINHSRLQELKSLRGWQLIFTLALEFQDAVAPRLRSIVDFLGRALVFLLTEVIGRGIGLIGRGILRGIGYAWQPEGKVRRPSNYN
ncbi:MAG: DUF3685 domain-containing protein [Pseudanabaenaceae cyanobacterium SKYGB_i_bin29]|nr:DUF3685 domain-containing protein [Pseudanabaenaceae cyanobacterium SKYG29]MDW8421359.1 DUF3685 domain-containing protein [Pseudanabaenaceae cyanobacterium SKYGB_i_bin29]